MSLAGPDQSIEEWSLVYGRIDDDLVRFAAFLVGPDGAEDVVSEAVIRVLRTDVQLVSNPAGYLYRTVSHTARNYLRGRSRRIDYESRLAPDRPSEMPDIRPHIAEAMASLSSQQRAVIYLTYWADFTPTQVAEYLGLTDGSVRKQLNRGRKKLRGLLNE